MCWTGLFENKSKWNTLDSFHGSVSFPSYSLMFQVYRTITGPGEAGALLCTKLVSMGYRSCLSADTCVLCLQSVQVYIQYIQGARRNIKKGIKVDSTLKEFQEILRDDVYHLQDGKHVVLYLGEY